MPKTKPCTRRFYSETKAILKNNGAVGKSTKSVFIVQNQETALAIHALASKCGVANLYVAEQLDA